MYACTSERTNKAHSHNEIQPRCTLSEIPMWETLLLVRHIAILVYWRLHDDHPSRLQSWWNQLYFERSWRSRARIWYLAQLYKQIIMHLFIIMTSKVSLVAACAMHCCWVTSVRAVTVLVAWLSQQLMQACRRSLMKSRTMILANSKISLTQVTGGSVGHLPPRVLSTNLIWLKHCSHCYRQNSPCILVFVFFIFFCEFLEWTHSSWLQ